MCGIVGVFRVKNSIIPASITKKALLSLYKESLSRGIDSSGAAFRSSTSIDIVRDSISANSLIKSNNFTKLLNQNIENLELIGHARMETNGSFALDYNNQPVVKDGCVVIHNGIIVNDKEIWENHPGLKRQFEVDTEIINSVLRENLSKDNNLVNSIIDTLKEVKGSYSLGIFLNDYNTSIFTTNTGSLYYLKTLDNSLIFIASELRFLENVLNQELSQFKDMIEIVQILPEDILFVTRGIENQSIHLHKNHDKSNVKYFNQTSPLNFSITNTEFSNKNIDKRIKNDDKFEKVSS